MEILPIQFGKFAQLLSCRRKFAHTFYVRETFNTSNCPPKTNTILSLTKPHCKQNVYNVFNFIKFCKRKSST